jgi:hypothetical protein
MSLKLLPGKPKPKLLPPSTVPEFVTVIEEWTRTSLNVYILGENGKRTHLYSSEFERRPFVKFNALPIEAK